MSNYTTLKTTINANIRQNGNQEITGNILNSVLTAMVNTLGEGYQFAGIAIMETDPGTPDAKVFYIAKDKGAYKNFGDIEVTEDEVIFLVWDNAWHKVATGIAADAQLKEAVKELTEIARKVDTKQDIIPDLEAIREGAGKGNEAYSTVASIVEAGYVFAGIATPENNPGTPNTKVFYIANGNGTYTNFGGLDVTEDGVAILYYDTAWHKVSTGIASDEKLSELDKEIGNPYVLVANVTGGGMLDIVSNPLKVDFKANEGFYLEVSSPNNSIGNTLVYFKNAETNNWSGAETINCVNPTDKVKITKNYPISAIAIRNTFTNSDTITISAELSESLQNKVNVIEQKIDGYFFIKRYNLYAIPLFRNFTQYAVNLKAGTYTFVCSIPSATDKVWIRLFNSSGTMLLDKSIVKGETETKFTITLSEDLENGYWATFCSIDTPKLTIDVVTQDNLPLRVAELEESVAGFEESVGSGIKIAENSVKQSYVLNSNIKTNNILSLDLRKWTYGLLDKLGNISYDSTYYHSDFIPVTPGTTIYLKSCVYVICYDKDKILKSDVSVQTTVNPWSFVIPEDIYYIRTNVLDSRLISVTNTPAFILEGEDGDYVEYKNDYLPERIYKRYSLIDATLAWMRGEKFPVAFWGDSTTDGVGTTGWSATDNSHESKDNEAGGRGKADWQHPYSYPYILEQMLRSELGNNILRIYNAGWGGASLYVSTSISPIKDTIFGYAYSDVKMVGIAMGLNDRVFVSTDYEYYETFKKNLKQACNVLLSMNVTPFMVSYNTFTQAGNNGDNTYNTVYQNYVQQLANKAKKEVAELYGLEYVDMNEFGSLILRCSNYPMGGPNSSIGITENLHFKDLGHKLEAGFLFTKFIPWVLKTESANKVYLGLSNPNFKCGIIMTGPGQSWTQDGFKTEMQKTKGDTSDVCIYDAYVFNNSVNGPYNVTYYTPVASGYIVVDGDIENPITIDSTNVVIGTWDIGLHHVQVYTGESTTVAFKGFLLEQN